MAWGGGEVCITRDRFRAVTTQKSQFLHIQKKFIFQKAYFSFTRSLQSPIWAPMAPEGSRPPRTDGRAPAALMLCDPRVHMMLRGQPQQERPWTTVCPPARNCTGPEIVNNGLTSCDFKMLSFT